MIFVEARSEVGLGGFIEGDVGGADVGGGEDGVEGGVGGGGFYVLAAALLAVYEAEDSDDVHAGLAGGFDGCDGGPAGGADVVDDDYVGA